MNWWELYYSCTRTRPNNCVAGGLVARRVADPREIDWIAAKPVLRYLKRTKDLALLFLKSRELEPLMYADADYAFTAERKSISGRVMTLGDNSTFDWKREKQSNVSLSTAEAEHVSQSEAARDITYFRKVLDFIGHGQWNATTLRQDNTAANAWAEQESHAGKAKHIDVRMHYMLA